MDQISQDELASTAGHQAEVDQALADAKKQWEKERERDTQQWISERSAYELKISRINDELSDYKHNLDLAVSETLMFQKRAEDSKQEYQTTLKTLTEKYKEEINDIVVKYDRQMREFEEKLLEMYNQSAASLVNKHGFAANLPHSFQTSDLPGKLHILEKIMKANDAKLQELEKIIEEQKEVVLKNVSRNHNEVTDSDGSVNVFYCYRGDLSEASPEKLREHIKKLESVLHTTEQAYDLQVGKWISLFYSCIQNRVSEQETYQLNISSIDDELSKCKQRLDLAVSDTLMLQKHAEDSKRDYQTKLKTLTEKYKEEISDIVVKYDRQTREFEEKLLEMYNQSAAFLVNKHGSTANLPQSFQESDLPGKLHILEKIMKANDAKLRELEKIIEEQKDVLKRVSRNHNEATDSDGSVTVLSKNTQQWISERSAYELKISRINDELSEYKHKLDLAVSETLMFQKRAEDSKQDYQTTLKTLTEKYKEEINDIVVKYDRQMREFEEKLLMYNQSAASLVNKHGSAANLPQSFQESDLPGKLHILEKIMKANDAKLRELEKIIEEQKEVVLKNVSRNHNEVTDSDGSVNVFYCYRGDLSEASPEKLREHIKKLESVLHTTEQAYDLQVGKWISLFYSCIQNRVSEQETYQLNISSIDDELSKCKQRLDLAVSDTLMLQKHAEDSKRDYQTKLKTLNEKYKEEISDIVVKYDSQMREFEEKLLMYNQSAASLVNKHGSAANLPQSYQTSDLPGKLHILEKIMKANDAKLQALETIIEEQKEVLKKVFRNHNEVTDSDGSVNVFDCYRGDLSEASPEKLREHIKKLESVLHTMKQKYDRQVGEWISSFYSCIQNRVSEQETYELNISSINDELSKYKQKLNLAASETLMFQKHAEDSKQNYQTTLKTLTEKYKEDISDIVVKYDRQMREFEEKLLEMYNQSAAFLVNKHGSTANLPQSFQESDLPGKLHILEKIMKANDAKLRELEKIIEEQKDVLKSF